MEGRKERMKKRKKEGEKMAGRKGEGRKEGGMVLDLPSCVLKLLSCSYQLTPQLKRAPTAPPQSLQIPWLGPQSHDNHTLHLPCVTLPAHSVSAFNHTDEENEAPAGDTGQS